MWLVFPHSFSKGYWWLCLCRKRCEADSCFFFRAMLSPSASGEGSLPALPFSETRASSFSPSSYVLLVLFGQEHLWHIGGVLPQNFPTLESSFSNPYPLNIFLKLEVFFILQNSPQMPPSVPSSPNNKLPSWPHSSVLRRSLHVTINTWGFFLDFQDKRDLKFKFMSSKVILISRKWFMVIQHVQRIKGEKKQQCNTRDRPGLILL